MYYVCIENDSIIGIQNYQPNVPDTVRVEIITEGQYQQLLAQTHRFDIGSGRVVELEREILDQKEQEKLNSIEREFLNSTDWKVLRHIRQKALEIPTSLSEAEYLELEQQRNQAASRII